VFDLLSLLTVEEADLDFLSFLFFNNAGSIRVAWSTKSSYGMPSNTTIPFLKSSLIPFFRTLYLSRGVTSPIYLFSQFDRDLRH
jgi:hypothetical protein